jgi:hypothetical protein
LAAVVDVVRGLRKIGIVRSIVPPTDKLAVGVGPVERVCHHLHLVAYPANILGELEFLLVVQLQAGAKVPVVGGPAFALDIKLKNERIRDQASFDGLVILDNSGHLRFL